MVHPDVGRRHSDDGTRDVLSRAQLLSSHVLPQFRHQSHSVQRHVIQIPYGLSQSLGIHLGWTSEAIVASPQPPEYIQHDHHVRYCLPIGHDDQQRAPTHQTDDQGGSPDSRQQSKARPAKIRTTRQLYCCKPGVQQTATDGHSLDDVHQRHGRQQSAGIVSHRQSRLNHKQVIETKENKLMDLNF